MLQALVTMTSCVGNAFITPILQRFDYSPMQIGATMTCAALAAAAAKPLWGFVNDRWACAKQVLMAVMAVGCAAYGLLILSGGNPYATVPAAMLLYVTFLCMMGFVDSWAVRLISDGWTLNYAATRAGGSFSYAVMAVAFGAVMQRRGPGPGLPILLVLLALLCVTALSLPNPRRLAGKGEQAVSMGSAVRYLTHNRIFLIAVAAYFLCSLTSTAMDSFFSVLVTDLGGAESQVGQGLFLQAMSEVPIMVAYGWFRRRARWPAAVFLGLGMAFFGIKCLGMGLAHSFPMLFAMTLLHGLCFATLTAGCVDFILENVEPAYLATAHLFYSAVGNSLGAVCGNALNGALAQRIGVGPMMRVISMGAFAGAILVFFTVYLGRKGRKT